MRDSFLVFGSPVIGEEEIAEVVDSLRSGWVGTGPKVQRFEQMLAEYVGASHARCVSSCTAALMLALRVLAIGRGDEVIVPTMTFVASANAVEHVGATPVFVDCDPVTGLIDLDAAAAAITERTRAIHARPSCGPAGGYRSVECHARPLWRVCHRGRCACDRRRMERHEDRCTWQPDRLLLLRPRTSRRSRAER